ncbi:hypothetical protein B0H10DRAFT_1945786 [Mycena sp. CBHHK59/15]|nr:hypothetical protein B0H10DRAFT_1945786 [Mycena sp. CBHHK59/15]
MFSPWSEYNFSGAYLITSRKIGFPINSLMCLDVRSASGYCQEYPEGPQRWANLGLVLVPFHAVGERVLQLVASYQTAAPESCLAKYTDGHGEGKCPDIEPKSPPARREGDARADNHPWTPESLVPEEQRQRDRKKGAKAAATRDKNGTSTGRRAASAPDPSTAALSTTPLTPTTAQNRPAPVPLTGGSCLSTQQTQPIIRQTQLLAATPQSSPSPLNQVQFPPRSRTPPSLVPDNYQPVYHDFGPLPGSGAHTSINNPTVTAPPNLSAAHFQQMIEKLSPEHLTQMNAILGTSLQPIDPGSSASLDLGQLGDQRGTWGGEDDYTNFGSDGSGFEGGGSGFPDDEGPTIKLATAPAMVLMHDVDVQRKKKRKRSAPEADLTSDADDSPAAPPGKKRTRRKRVNRRQKSRSIQEFTGDRRRVIEAAFPLIQKAVCLKLPWPLVSPSGDPAADDDDFEALIDDAYDDAVERLKLDPCEFNSQNLSNEERNLVCGCIMMLADGLVASEYGFTDVASLDDPTPENIAAVEENPEDVSDIATICCHRIFQKLLNRAFFAKKGINRRSYYFAGKDLLPLETLGLLNNSIVCGIDRWKTGCYQMVSFDAEIYATVHEQSMVFLNAWVAEYTLDAHPVNLAEVCRREFLTKARCADSFHRSVWYLKEHSTGN